VLLAWTWRKQTDRTALKSHDFSYNDARTSHDPRYNGTLKSDDFSYEVSSSNMQNDPVVTP
jgi:hypothetical protein